MMHYNAPVLKKAQKSQISDRLVGRKNLRSFSKDSPIAVRVEDFIA